METPEFSRASLRDFLYVLFKRKAQINSETEILKGRSLIQDVVTSLGPATIYPDLATEKKGIPAAVIPGRSREDKTPAENALLGLQKKLEVQEI